MIFKKVFVPFLVFVSLVAALPACGGSAPSTPQLIVEGKVTRGVYFNSGGDTYKVEVHVRNSSGAVLTFEVAEGAFFPSEGKGVSATVSKIDGTLYKLETGQEESFVFDSNGYTSDLLVNAKGGPIFFQLTLLSKGKSTVAGPFQARLPSLEEIATTSETPLVFK